MKKNYLFKNWVLFCVFSIVTMFGANSQITSYPFMEGFDAATIPAGWADEFVSGTDSWDYVTNNGNSTISPRTGARMAEYRVASFAAPQTKLVTPQLDLTGLTNPMMTFYYANVAWGSDIDEMRVFYKTSAAGSWVQLGPDYTAEQTSWTEITVSLPSPSADYYVAIEGTSSYGRGLNIDDFSIYAGPPATPPTPTEVAGTPDCVNGTNIDVTGSPATDVTWYWQGTNASGTSLANPYAGPYNVMNNGTYYLRAYNSVTTQWSVASSSITISSIPVASMPTAPFATVDPSCVTTGSELNVALSPSSNETYYWQGVTMNGTSTANVAATDVLTNPYNAPTSGTYYVANFDASTSCWSPTVGVTITVQTYIPEAPTAATSNYNVCSGSTSQMISATAPASGSVTIPLTTNYSLAPGATGIFNGNLAIPSGATITSATVTFNGVTTSGYTYLNDLSFDMTGSITQANTSLPGGFEGTNAGPFPFPVTANPAGGAFTLNLTDNYGYGNASTIGSITVVVDYSLPAATIEWYDMPTNGNLEGTGSPFESIGTTLLPSPAANGSYDFYAGTLSGACQSATREQVTINVLDVNIALTAIDETCVGYMNGSFQISDTLCGVTPFDVDVDGNGFGAIPTNLGPGTYTVTVRDAAMNLSTPAVLTVGTAGSYIPAAPTATIDQYNICSGETSQMIEATATASGSVTIPLTTNYSLAPGSTGVFNGNLTLPSGATVTSATVTFNGVTTSGYTYLNDLSFDMTGSITQADTYLPGGFEGTNAGPFPFPVTANSAGGAFTLNLTDNYGYGNASTINSITVVVDYSLPAATIEWYDMATNGNLEGTGSPFESVGTTILPSPAANGSYEFYAGSISGGCYSTSRTLVTVNVNDVNVELTAIDAVCNGSATGSFEISDTICGAIPFLVDIDGNGFGAIPTDMLAGTYMVTVQDNNGANSAAYTLVIGEAGAPSDAYMEDITDNGGQVSWNSNGNEAEWNVEWGLPGFIPGTGTEIGSSLVTDTFAIISGLDANTNYDVYISANCGVGSTTGGWDMVNWTTDCGIYGLPFVETFEDNSITRVCWYNINEVGSNDWVYASGANYNVTTAFEGAKNAQFETDFVNYGDPIIKLASPRFDFTGQDSVAVIFSYLQENASGYQNEMKVYTIGSSPVWTELAYYPGAADVWTTDTLYVADTTTQIAFEGINYQGPSIGVDYVQVLPCTLNSGVDGSANVCRADGTFDLNSIVTLGETFGKWTFAQNPSALNDNILDVTTLPTGTFNFYYIVKTPCAVDTTTATLTIFPPSSAGVDGTITACRNEPIYLLSGLSGTIDLGGQWYNPSNNPTTVNITTSNIPGNYNFDYITSNGVCPNDTSNILITVGTCDYLDVQELVFGDMEVYPNPTDGLVFISNAGSSQVFNYELLDVTGKVISAKNAAINGTTTTEVSLEKLEPGIYMIKVYNTEAEKTFRVIKQ